MQLTQTFLYLLQNGDFPTLQTLSTFVSQHSPVKKKKKNTQPFLFVLFVNRVDSYIPDLFNRL